MEGIKFMCINCGKEAEVGSMKNPYCKRCFKKIWKNDTEACFKWLEITH